MEDVTGKSIFVGLSGGVDSAVTAALLKKAGAEVTGVFIKGWYPPGMPCTWASDRRDAMRVAAHLGIPFHTLDASIEYKKSVIDYLLSEYRSGRTPNPDIMCNREVKFGAFYRFALEKNADYIATGHYARAGEGSLSRGVDSEKDQSYFLWAVPREAVRKTLFPLGEMEKKAVRRIADDLHLPVAHKKDSQGICFLGSISVEDFLRTEFGESVGEAIDETGSRIGRHTGVLLHTIGQRISLEDAPPGPWYVTAKDIGKNILIVSKSAKNHTAYETFELIETNWFKDIDPGKRYEAQYRYHGPRISGILSEDGAVFTPSDARTVEPVAKGQSLVIYDADTVVGGGIIA